MFPSGSDFEQLALAAESGILIHEAVSKNILWANPAACAMFGFTLEELRPLKAHHMSSPEASFRRSIGVAWLQEALLTGRSARRWKYRTAEGQDFLTYAVAKRVLFADGPVIVVTFRPMDAEQHLRDRLTQTTDYLHRLMSHAAAGVILLDDEHRIVDTSPAVAGLFASRGAEVLGRRLTELANVHPADALDADDSITGGVEMRLEVPGAEGVRWLVGTLERVSHDGISSRLLVVRDITRRAELEQAAEYKDANLQYLSRYNAMGDMAMIIAHELGQPLAAATNFLSGIVSRLDADTLSPAELRSALERAQRQLTRSSEIVASVKRYVRRIESTVADEDLNDIIADILYFARLRAAERGVTIEAELAPYALPIRAEHILLGQVLLNLCFNAIDEVAGLGSERRVLNLVSFVEGGNACCSVTDLGRGIGPRANDALVSGAFSSKADGSGIGLLLSSRIIERHRGELELTPHTPSGTTATMRIPLRAE